MISQPADQKLLLILDLDETLMHASPTKLRDDFDFQVFGYFVYKRPGLDAFLLACAGKFQLAVWSSASDDYVAEMVKRIFPETLPLAFVWGRTRCTPIVMPTMDDAEMYNLDYFSHYVYSKQLKKVKRLGFDLRQVLIVDDTPAKVRNSYGNAIYPTPYTGAPDDRELEALGRYLDILKTVENTRTIEKRQWQQRLSADASHAGPAD